MVFNSSRAKDFPRKASVHLTKDEEKKEEDTIKYPFTNLRIALAILGVVPCLFQRPYWPSWDIRKSSMIYCIFINTFVIITCYFTGLDLKEEYEAENPSNIVMRALKVEFGLLMLPHLFALALLCDVQNFSRCMERFAEVEVNFYKATGHKLENRRKKLEIIFGCFTTGPATLYIFITEMIPFMQLKKAWLPSLLYGNTSGCILCFFLIGSLSRVLDALEDTKTDFLKHIADGDLTSTTVFGYRKVWLSLRALLDALAGLHSTSSAYSLSLVLVTILLYEGTTILLCGEIPAAIGHYVTASIYMTLVFSCLKICDDVQVKMKCMVADVLPRIKLTSYDLGTQREIIMLYLVEGARPAKMTFQGMVTLNKHLVLSFFSNVATYIVVLVQVMQKNDDGDEEHSQVENLQ